MKLYVSKRHRITSIVSTIFACIAFMLLMPYGSFDPRNYGFWLCIVLGVSIGLTTDFVLAKFRQKYGIQIIQ